MFFGSALFALLPAVARSVSNSAIRVRGPPRVIRGGRSSRRFDIAARPISMVDRNRGVGRPSQSWGP